MICDEDHDASLIADSAPRANNASRLPIDIYLEIFDIMKARGKAGIFNFAMLRNMGTYKRDLSNWALTSRSFRNICQQRIFEYINFAGDGSSNPSHSIHAEFCREIASGNESARTLASYVKICRLECSNAPWSSSSAKQSALDFSTSRTQVVACMTNLETLSICSTPVTRELLGVIGSLKLLKSCSFCISTFALILPGDIRPDLFSPTLTSLTLLWPHWYDLSTLSKPLVGAIPASLKFLEADNQELTRELINSSHISGLVELDLRLYRDQYEDLGRFLNRLHSLRCLVLYRMDCYPHISPNHLNLSPSALPLLTSVQCPPQLALELVRGRPVKRLSFYGEPILVEALAALKYSTAKDQSLDIIDPSMKTLQSLPSIDCPHLTRLCISTTGKKEEILENDLRTICRIWQQSLSLRSLHIQNLIGGTYNLPYHNMLISQAVESFPALSTISFMRDVEWQYTESAECWEPVIHRNSRGDLRRHIMDYGKAGVTVDFEGCYAGLFTEDELNDVLPKLRAS